jgi:hypothetical protein
MPTLTADFPADARSVAAKLDKAGFICLENVISPDWLERARAHVRSLLDKHGEKFIVIIRPADEEGSAANEIAYDPMMETLLRNLAEIGCPSGVMDGEGIYNVLRVVAGADGEKGSCEFHYDANVITALVPIFIPDAEEGQSGELVVCPNSRGYRNILVNLIEKAVVQSRPYRQRMARKFRRNPEENRRLLRPGNVYLFWGYRTYHGNLPSPSNGLRATLLLHYGNPHGKRAVLQSFRALRKLIERRRLTQPASESAARVQSNTPSARILHGLDGDTAMPVPRVVMGHKSAFFGAPKQQQQQRDDLVRDVEAGSE